MIPPTKKVASMVFVERMVTHKKWLKSFSWQMTLMLGLSEPPCGGPSGPTKDPEGLDEFSEKFSGKFSEFF